MARYILLFLLLIAGVAQAAADPMVIIPGQGFGHFLAALGIGAIEKMVKPGEFGEGESDSGPSAEMYMLDPKKRVTVQMDSKKKIKAMAIHGLESVWHTREGITLGTSLATLEKLNGRAFHFRAFEGEHGGEIVDWGGGKLAASLPRVTITFASPMHARGYGTMSEKDKLELERPHIFSSADPAARALNPVVETIELSF
jgi:hypothetical protein